MNKYIVKATARWQFLNLECKETGLVPTEGTEMELPEDRAKQLIKQKLVVFVREAKETARKSSKKKAEEK